MSFVSTVKRNLETNQENLIGKKVLFLDFETDSADPKTARPTEVGALLTEYQGTVSLNGEMEVGYFAPLHEYNRLIWEDNYPPLSKKIVTITGITDEMLQKQGVPRLQILQDLLPMVEQCDIICAHKTYFDMTILKEMAKFWNKKVPVREELCTLTNFEWPEHLTCHKLGHLAWELGLDVKARDLHRAINDVELLVKLVSLKPLEEVLAYARTPWVYLMADVIAPWQDGKVQTTIAKSHGFTWEEVRGFEGYKWPKKWVARVKRGKEQELFESVRSSQSPFRISIIEGIS